MATTDPPSEEIARDTNLTDQSPEETGQDMDVTGTTQEPDASTQPLDLVDTPDAAIPPSEETQDATATPPKQPEEEVVSKETKPVSPSLPPPSVPEVVFKPEWAPTVDRDVVIDRIKGCIYGNALGDAMGLATEFMSKAEVKKLYQGSGPIAFASIVQDFHRYRWKQGDWTDDTDQMLLIMDGIIESGGKVVATDFARKLLRWAREGYAELKDTGGMGIGMTVHSTISHSVFETDPHTAARQVWENSGKNLAANGAVMRTSILGILSFNSLEIVKRNTLEISLTTHTDPRCSASCVAVTSLIAQLIAAGSKADISSIVAKSIEQGASLIEDEDKKTEFVNHMKFKSLQELHLDEAKSIGYTLKCAGTAFVGINSKVKTDKDFIKFMTELVREGGDADTNGAVAGAVVGCKIGYKNLPKEWLKVMPHIEWLDCRVEKFLNCIGLGPDVPTV